MEQRDKLGAHNLECLEIVNHVGVDHSAHLDLVILRICLVVIVREINDIRLGLFPESCASEHAGSQHESLVKATGEASCQIR